MINKKHDLIILNQNKIITSERKKKKINKLPIILSKKEIELLISTIKNKKHKLIIAL
jgi:Holliday junction resolvase